MDEKVKRTLPIFLIFSFFILLFFVLLFFMVQKSSNLGRSAFWETERYSPASRGSIYSSDDFNLASSQVLYKVGVQTKSINPDKKELFVNLFSIYSGISAEEINNRLKQKGYTILSYSVPANVAANIRQLGYKLLAYDVFKEYQDSNGKIIQKMGIDVSVSGINRNYAYGDVLEPILGYVQKRETRRMTIPEGIKGLEKFYNASLMPQQNGYEKGERDIRSNIIRNREMQSIERIDGADIYLHINLGFQRKVERALDSFYQKYQVDEIVAGVMDPQTGAILALATTRRFDPKKITSNESLNASVIERPFEPGSTIKPIVFSVLLDKKLINPLESIDLNKGYYQLGKYTIKDDTFPSKNSIVQDVLIRSSNVGMVKLSKKLSGQELYDGFKKFGISELTGIDLPYERDGIIPNAKKLASEAYKASASYGYGLSTTFMQLLRAYGVFCNDGVLVTPSLVKKIVSSTGEEQKKRIEQTQAIAPYTARKIQDILIRTVEEGTGKRAKVEGLIVGGKTGTARIAKKEGGYSDEFYNGSFFGFAKDEHKTYVIGVVAFGTHGKEDYYGSQTAAPIFKEIVQIMQKQNFFTTKDNK